jgi:hypothetical protein
MARITRMAFAYDQMKNSSMGASAKLSHPVVVIPGANHASFLTGEPPHIIKKKDLRPTAPFEQIKSQMSDVTAAFITVTRLGQENDAAKVLEHYVENVTAPMIEPILEVFDMENTPFLSSFT